MYGVKHRWQNEEPFKFTMSLGAHINLAMCAEVT